MYVTSNIHDIVHLQNVYYYMVYISEVMHHPRQMIRVISKKLLYRLFSGCISIQILLIQHNVTCSQCLKWLLYGIKEWPLLNIHTPVPWMKL